MTDHNHIGRAGENEATDYLKARGFKILERNYRYRRGEIDVIALHQQTLVFVEVKTRSGDTYGTPEQFVNRKKTKLMQMAATHYIESNNWMGDLRFDVIAILRGKTNELTHFEDVIG